MDRTFRVNDRIRTREVRVIDQNGQQLGIMTPQEALSIARERELDLIEVAPTARPPVCRIMDWGRFKYEQRRREKEQHRATRSQELKMVRLRPATDDHDFATKQNTARRFLAQGRKVRVNMIFRGRELAHQDLARVKMQRLANGLSDVAVLDRPPLMEGRSMVMVFSPRPDQASREEKKSKEQPVGEQLAVPEAPASPEPGPRPPNGASGAPEEPAGGAGSAPTG